MSHPTTLNPYFVIYRNEGSDDGKVATGYSFTEYFTNGEVEGDKKTFTTKKSIVMLFTNLASAARIAQVEGGMIRALVTKEEYEEFGRR
jgi:hypothetical protein